MAFLVCDMDDFAHMYGCDVELVHAMGNIISKEVEMGNNLAGDLDLSAGLRHLILRIIKIGCQRRLFDEMPAKMAAPEKPCRTTCHHMP